MEMMLVKVCSHTSIIFLRKQTRAPNIEMRLGSQYVQQRTVKSVTHTIPHRMMWSFSGFINTKVFLTTQNLLPCQYVLSGCLGLAVWFGLSGFGCLVTGPQQLYCLTWVRTCSNFPLCLAPAYPNILLKSSPSYPLDDLMTFRITQH